jgi:hypothetical protein
MTQAANRTAGTNFYCIPNDSPGVGNPGVGRCISAAAADGHEGEPGCGDDNEDHVVGHVDHDIVATQAAALSQVPLFVSIA